MPRFFFARCDYSFNIGETLMKPAGNILSVSFGYYFRVVSQVKIWVRTMNDGSREYVLNAASEHGVKFIRLWFTDILGFLKSVAIHVAQLDSAFT